MLLTCQCKRCALHLNYTLQRKMCSTGIFLFKMSHYLYHCAVHVAFPELYGALQSVKLYGGLQSIEIVTVDSHKWRTFH